MGIEFPPSGGGKKKMTPGDHSRELERRWNEEDRAGTKAAIQKYAPPIKSIPSCQVCQSPHRPWIESQLVSGVAYLAISKALPQGDGGASRKSIAHHYKNHMALEQAAMRAILEEEADLLGQNYEEGVRGAITHRGILEVAVRKGFEDIQNGITTVEFRDMVQAIKQLREMDTNTSNAQIEEATTAVRLFMEAIKAVGAGLDSKRLTIESGDALAIAIQAEVKRLRDREEIVIEAERMLDRHIGLPTATYVEDDNDIHYP